MSITDTRSPSTSLSADKGIRRRLWTREEYHRAAELGPLRPEEFLELLEGGGAYE